MCEAIERKEAECRVFYTPDFPQRAGLTIVPSIPGGLALHESLGVDLSDCGAVWVRRTFYPKAPAEFDETDCVTIERECREMRQSFFDLLGQRACWVNPLRAHETPKPSQLVAALRCGFRIPPTIVSNDPAEILCFIRAAPGQVVFKTFSGQVPTTVLGPELVAEPELLRWTPGIYQHYIEKEFELRVTVVGRRLFTVRINSQESMRGRIDWREAQRRPRGHAADLVFMSAALPPLIEARCLQLMESLGLVFGAIDLIVTPQKEIVFLEVNAAGQFLWIESEMGLPLLDVTSELLLQGRVDFAWDARSPRVRFDCDFERAVFARQEKAMAEHVSDLRV
jgi:hypothetical protein